MISMHISVFFPLKKSLIPSPLYILTMNAELLNKRRRAMIITVTGKLYCWPLGFSCIRREPPAFARHCRTLVVWSGQGVACEQTQVCIYWWRFQAQNWLRGDKLFCFYLPPSHALAFSFYLSSPCSTLKPCSCAGDTRGNGFWSSRRLASGESGCNHEGHTGVMMSGKEICGWLTNLTTLVWLWKVDSRAYL